MITNLTTQVIKFDIPRRRFRVLHRSYSLKIHAKSHAIKGEWLNVRLSSGIWYTQGLESTVSANLVIEVTEQHWQRYLINIQTPNQPGRAEERFHTIW